MNKYNLKEVLQVLYKDLESDDSDVVLQANEMIDRILAENFQVSILALFLYEIRNKDCIRNLRKLLIGLEVTDFEIAKALSSTSERYVSNSSIALASKLALCPRFTLPSFW